MQITILVVALLFSPPAQKKNQADANVTAGIQTAYEGNRLGASAAMQAGDLEKAADFYQQNIELGKSQKPPSQFEIAEASSALARIRQSQHRYNEAETLFEQSIKAYESDRAPDEDQIALNAQALGMVYLQKSEYTRAESMFQRSLSLHSKEREKSPWPQVRKAIDVNVERDLFGLASARFQAGDPQAASGYCDKAITAGQESSVSKSEMMLLLKDCAVVKRTAGRKAEAVELEKRREALESSH